MSLSLSWGCGGVRCSGCPGTASTSAASSCGSPVSSTGSAVGFSTGRRPRPTTGRHTNTGTPSCTPSALPVTTSAPGSSTGTETDHRSSVDAAQGLLKQWLDAVPSRRYGDIAIRPFRHEFDGVLFGLVIEIFEGAEHAELYPDTLGFYEP
ncbi:hypothetical protein [Streptosporangium sp. NPDC006007]|uniref:hypothetical protein n=1 Tax=Streptosporangium sp. NPDC006007 TaxID=3154575 RepID=UPI0033B15673